MFSDAIDIKANTHCNWNYITEYYEYDRGSKKYQITKRLTSMMKINIYRCKMKTLLN